MEEFFLYADCGADYVTYDSDIILKFHIISYTPKGKSMCMYRNL